MIAEGSAKLASVPSGGAASGGAAAPSGGPAAAGGAAAEPEKEAPKEEVHSNVPLTMLKYFSNMRSQESDEDMGFGLFD